MAEVGGAALGSALSVVGSAIVQPAINRYLEGRQLSRGQMAVYVPGTGRMMDFDSHEENRGRLGSYLRREKWITHYLKSPVIDLGELASALQATGLLRASPTADQKIENSVMVLGTRDPAKKLEGIMLALQEGFLNKYDSAEGTRKETFLSERVPWKLLRETEIPEKWCLEDYKLLDIWFALHCEYIFPVSNDKVVAAANTYHRICKWTDGAESYPTASGHQVRRHFELPMEQLVDIARTADLELTRNHSAPRIGTVSEATRLAGMLGGLKTFELLGDGCAESITQALKEIEYAHKLGLNILVDDEDEYVIRAVCSQGRAGRDHRMTPDGYSELSLNGLATIRFPKCKMRHGSLILDKRLSQLVPGEVFANPNHVLEMCQKVDQSMALNKKLSSYSEECRIAEVQDHDFAKSLFRGELTLDDADFKRIVWAESEHDGTLLTIYWRTGIDVCLVDTIASRVSVQQIRLPVDEPVFIQFVGVRGTDVELEVAHVQRPVGQGFREVDYGESYCYLQRDRVFCGKYKPIGTVGIWHQTASHVDFGGDGMGLLGGRETEAL